MNQAKFMEQQTQHSEEVGYKAVLTQTKNKWRSANYKYLKVFRYHLELTLITKYR